MLNADGVIGTMKGICHIAGNDIDPMEQFTVVILAFIVRDDRFMIADSLPE